jgi:hypothetical protein
MRGSFDRATRSGRYLARVGNTVGFESDEFVSEAVDTILAAQTEQAGATWAYLTEAGEMFDGRVMPYDAPVDKLIGSATHNKTALETVYRRPQRLAGELRAAGVSEPEISARLAQEVERLAHTDVAVSGRKAEQAFGSIDRRIIGWNRVTNAGACDFCILIAQHYYTKRDLAPAHADCHCGTSPRYAEAGDEFVDEKAVARLEENGVPLKQAQRTKDAQRVNRIADKLDSAPPNIADAPAGRGLPPGASYASDDLDIVNAAARNNVSPDEVKAAQGRVKAIKQQARDEAARTMEEAGGQLQQWNYSKIKRPPRGAERARAGEYDWLERIDARERARLSRKWYSDNGIGIDELADLVDGPGSTMGVDEAVGEWLAVNRRFEAAGSIRRGKLPSSRAYSGEIDVDDLVPNFAADGYDVRVILGADDIEAAAHIAGVEKELLQREALQYLEQAANPVEGPSPYKMSFQAWEEELRSIEYGLREYPNEMPSNTRARLRELVPEALDDGEDYEDLYAKIIDTAYKAGEEMPEYALIPWK